MGRPLAARAATLALQLVLISVAVVAAARVAPRITIVPLPHLKNPALTGAEVRSVLVVYLGWHLAAYLLSAAALRQPAFSSARRALGELFVLMTASSLASCHLFLFSLVPFSANLHAWVGALGPVLHGLALFGFTLARHAGRGRPVLGPPRWFRSRPQELAASRWALVTAALVAAPGLLAVLYKKNGDFANLVNRTRVSLNMGGATTYALVDAWPGLVFDQPMDVRFAPDGAAYVLERPGRLVRIDPKTPARDVILDLSDEVGACDIELGALSVALHPEFGREDSPSRGFAYLYYTSFRPGTQRNRLARFDLSPPTPDARKSTKMLLSDQGRPASGFHNGGSVFFDREGFLLWTCGDFALRRCQRLDDALSGGIMRIDVDRRGGDVSGPILRQPQDGVTANYFIPKTNPWAGRPDALGELWALGFRNPFRASLDPETGEVWVGDVGLDGWEEVSKVAAGANGQWPFREGSAPGHHPPPATVIGRETPPVHAYGQNAVDRCVIGGLVHRGERHPRLRGRYVFADNNSGVIRALDPARPEEPPEVVARCELLGQQGITSLNPGPGGELLITALGSKRRPSGRVLRLEEAGEGVTLTVATSDAPKASPEAVMAKYEQVCARCHGLDGKGGQAGDGIAPRPDFSDPAFHAARSDEALKRAVLEGGLAIGKSRDMPAWRGFFDDAELEVLVKRLRAFAAERGAK